MSDRHNDFIKEAKDKLFEFEDNSDLSLTQEKEFEGWFKNRARQKFGWPDSVAQKEFDLFKLQYIRKYSN